MDENSRNILDKLICSSTLDADLLDQFPHALMLINQNRIVLKTNKSANELGVKVGHFCWDTFGQCASIPEQDKAIFQSTGKPPKEGTKCLFCHADQALALKCEQKKEVTVGETVWDTYWIPVGHDTFLHFGIQVQIN